MTTLEQLDRWLSEGVIDPAQHAAISAIVSRRRISVFLELNALLYLGVLALAGGLAWTASTYSDAWGDAAILLPLTGLFAGCLYYCFTRAHPFSPLRQPAPGLVFDYVLYLACLTFAVALGYVEYRFGVLQGQWDYYLLASAVLYLTLAYRFDNRFVLSLGISTLGGWFGVRLSRSDPFFFQQAVRMSALAYGVSIAAVGVQLARAGIKQHFLDTYLHVAANVVLGTLASGVVGADQVSLWLVALLAAAATSIVGGVKFRRFVFVVYGVTYGYVGVSRELLRHVDGDVATFAYLVVSATAVVTGLLVLARRVGRGV